MHRFSSCLHIQQVCIHVHQKHVRSACNIICKSKMKNIPNAHQLENIHINHIFIQTSHTIVHLYNLSTRFQWETTITCNRNKSHKHYIVTLTKDLRSIYIKFKGRQTHLWYLVSEWGLPFGGIVTPREHMGRFLGYWWLWLRSSYTGRLPLKNSLNCTFMIWSFAGCHISIKV